MINIGWLVDWLVGWPVGWWPEGRPSVSDVPPPLFEISGLFDSMFLSALLLFCLVPLPLPLLSSSFCTLAHSRAYFPEMLYISCFSFNFIEIGFLIRTLYGIVLVFFVSGG